MNEKLCRSSSILRVGLLLCVAGIAGWSDGQVGVDYAHIAHWNTGADVDHPIAVNRDNPWFKGWYSAEDDRWMYSAGTYSNIYENGPFAAGFLSTTEWPMYSWANSDDWQNRIRGIEGYQDSTGVGSLSWSVRTGKFVPGALYGSFVQTHLQVSFPTWYKLDDNVMVVPVIVVSWHVVNGSAGSEDWQDFRTRADALFDFIPFQASNHENWPADWPIASLWPWMERQAEDPTEYYDPPDDIWTQCGIQFQVVRSFKFDAPIASPNCSGYPDSRDFDTDYDRDYILIEGEIGTVERQLLITDLKPVFANFGYLQCPNFRGKSDPLHPNVEIDRADSDRKYLVAHELGHILGLNHCGTAPDCPAEDPNNLMMADGFGEQLTPVQCDAARIAARDFNALSNVQREIRPSCFAKPLHSNVPLGRP